MINRRKKNFINRILFNQITLTVIGLVIIVVISVPLARNISKRYYINKEIKELKKEIARLEDKNLNLRGIVDYLGSDQFIEEQARLNLGLKKEGEEVVIIQDNVTPDTDENPEDADNMSKYFVKDIKISKKVIRNPEKWWGYFFD